MSLGKYGGIQLHMDETPQVMPRPRAKKGQGAYYPPAYTNWRDKVVWKLRSLRNKHLGGKPLEGPVMVTLHFYDDDIVVTIEDAMPRNKLRGDLDNYVKAMMDAMTIAGIWEDDQQVTQLAAGFGVVVDMPSGGGEQPGSSGP